MDEDPLQPDPEKPRYLLPEGCKDLIDALRLQQPQTRKVESPGWTVYPPSAEPAQPLPVSVTLPDPVRVCDLAAALHLKVFEIIHVLMNLNIFAALNTELDFATASSICTHYGVAAHRAA